MIGNRLRDIRKLRHLTQQQVADKVGLSRPAYTAYEIGKNIPDGPMTARLADIFDVTTDYILERTDNPLPLANVNDENVDLMANHLDKDYKDLSDEDKRQLDNFMKFLKSNRQE